MGFLPDWLGLREPADHAARDADLLRRAANAAGPNPVILDLGCGTGSTVRALTAFLPPTVKWRLVDNDPMLLELAGTAAGGSAVSLHCQDLQSLEQLPLGGVSLVTASALLDLVSKKWLVDLASLVGVPVYFALSYNGIMQWDPEDSRDALVTEAFNAHQKTDKGFGTALGPDSVDTAREVFTDLGFDVFVATSPWQLAGEDEKLQRELLAGIARAAEQAGASEARAWGVFRTSAASNTSCTIGHGDVLAIPKSLVSEVNYALS